MDASAIDRDLNCTPLGDARELERPAATMTFYARVWTGRARYVSVTLPYVASIADEAHYQPPPPPLPEYFRERPAPAMTRKAVRRAIPKTNVA